MYNPDAWVTEKRRRRQERWEDFPEMMNARGESATERGSRDRDLQAVEDPRGAEPGNHAGVERRPAQAVEPSGDRGPNRLRNGAGTHLLPYNRSSRWSPTRSEFAIAVNAGFTAPMLGKMLVSTT
jgi:hypothetical protein